MKYDPIEDKILITKSMIRRYEESINIQKSCNKDYSHIVEKMNLEKLKLEELKMEYPEYFI